MSDYEPIETNDDEIPSSASRVVLDGRTDAEKIVQLSKMKKEDIRLDFKAFMEPSKIKIRELVKDVVAMANAEGGYIIVGVDEENNYCFCGLPSIDLESKLTSSNFQQVLSEYTKAVVEVSASWEQVQEGEKEAKCFVIYTKASNTPAIFEKEYKEGRVYAFRQGDYWIRKGSSNSRATSADMHALIDRVRTQERQQLSGVRRLDEQIAGLLQRIANNLDGNTGCIGFGILDLPAEQIKIESDRVFGRSNPTDLRKVLKRFRRTLKTELYQLRKMNSVDADAAIVAWIDRMVPVLFCLWVSAVDDGTPILVKEIIEAIINLLDDTWYLRCGVDEEKWALGLHRPITFLVVAMAALAIERNNPHAAGIAVDVHASQDDDYWSSYSLIRYAQVISSRANQMNEFSFGAMASDYFADKQYVVEEFGDSEEMLNAFISAELLQNLRMVAQNPEDPEAVRRSWPGFVVYVGTRMERMILSVIKTPNEWLGIEDRKQLAETFFKVEQSAREVASRSHFFGRELKLYVPAMQDLYSTLD